MVDISSLDQYELEQLRDAVNRRLLLMRHTTRLTLPELLRLFDDVKVALRDQGKEWWSLETWQWRDGGIRFWLNPRDQARYQPGWYSIDELIAWTQDAGPVLVPFDDEPDDGDERPDTDAGVTITWLPPSPPDHR